MEDSADESLPELEARPVTVSLNTKEGYRINPFLNAPVYTQVNAFGDTVKTGTPYRIAGREISSEQIKLSQRTVAGQPAVRRVYSNQLPVTGMMKHVTIEDNVDPELITENERSTFVLTNNTGDTIPSGRPVPLKEIKSQCSFEPPFYSPQRMASRYDAVYNFKIINADQGLFNTYITALLEDSKGNLWIGTNAGGLLRYDGYSFVRINSQTKWLAFITDLLEDSHGNIWIATDGRGVFRFDGESIMAFTQKNGLSRDRVSCLLEDRHGDIWFGTFGGGVCRYHPAEGNQPGTLTHYTPREGLHGMYFYEILEDSDGNLWFGSGAAGITYWENPGNGQQGRIRYMTRKEGLLSDSILDMEEDQYSNIWIATPTGVCRYSKPRHEGKGRMTQFVFKQNISNSSVAAIYEDKIGNIWIGSHGEGVFKLSPDPFDPQSFESLTQFSKKDGLSHNSITTICEDRNGNILLGTRGGGISCIRSRMIQYMGENEGLTQYGINGMFENKKGEILLATNGDGLIIYSPGKNGSPGTCEHYTSKTGLPSDFITAVAEDEDGVIWMGVTGLGICRFDGKVFSTYIIDSGPANNYARSLMVDHQGTLWIVTVGNGISVLNPGDFNGKKKPGLIRYTEKEGLLDTDIRTIYKDRRDNIWIGSAEGLSRLNILPGYRNGTIIHYTEKEGLPSHFVNAIAETEGGSILIGTGSGLVFYDPSMDTTAGTFTYYPGVNTIIRSVLEDPSGNIWAGSISNLYVLLKQDDPAMPYRPFDLYRPDGLKGGAFLINSVLFDKNNTAYWGIDQGGVQIIDLDHFELNLVVPQPELRGIEINEEHFDFRNLTDDLAYDIHFDSVSAFGNNPHHLSLAYKYNHLNFYFSAIQLTNEHRIGYTFRLNGLDHRWSNLSWDPKVEYRGLPYGSYTFQFRAKSESEQWSNVYEYPFRIRPPWWYSWWAYIAYGLLGSTIVYGTYRIQLSRKLAMAERQRLVEIDRIKNRLYTNITHEFRTPLTLIHGPVTQALKKNAVLEQKDIQSIYRQSERLQQLINQMLELQKLEAGMLKPHLAYGEIIQVLRYLFASFETWAKDKNISMLFSSSLQEVYMDFDQEKLTQIISNLISNAIKHTPHGGKVAMIINPSPSADFLLINISDTGTGISEEDLPYIFDRFYQSRRASTGGTGIGLALVKNLTDLLGGQISVESKIDSGSTFKLSLPVTRHAHQPAHPPRANEADLQELHDEEINFITPEPSVPGKPIVLIVEDHPEVLQFIASCLANDYTTISAMDGNEGLRLAYERIPDLIISDVMMPGKDGFELCNILKSDIQTSHIPIILLTGRGDHEAVMKGIGQGADAYITKPFDPEEVLLRIKKMLELRATLSQYYRKHATTENPENVQQSSAKENEFLQKIRSFVEEHLNDSRFNMEMLCHQMAMSHPQLHRKITALTGESTGKFVRSVRLARALDLLRNSDLTISEIAYETGFSEPGYFTKVFSKEFNMTPSEYRAGDSI